MSQSGEGVSPRLTLELTAGGQTIDYLDVALGAEPDVLERIYAAAVALIVERLADEVGAREALR